MFRFTLVDTTGMTRDEALVAQYGPITPVGLTHGTDAPDTERVVLHVLAEDIAWHVANGLSVAAAIAHPTTRHGVTHTTQSEVRAILREDGGMGESPVTDRVARRHRAAFRDAIAW